MMCSNFDPKTLFFSFDDKGRVTQYKDFGNVLGLETIPPDVASFTNWDGPFETSLSKSVTYKPSNLTIITDVFQISPVSFTAVAKLGNLVDRAPIIAFSKNDQGRFSYVNDNFLRIFDLKQKDVIGNRIGDVFERFPLLRGHNANSIIQDSVVVKHTGTHFNLCIVEVSNVSSTQGPSQSPSQNFVALVALLEKDTRSNSSLVKTQFLANMSHEIRTPIHTIIQLVTLAKDSKLTAEQEETLDGIQKSCGQLMSTVNDILDFSRLQEGAIRPEYVDVDVSALIEDLSSLHGWTSRRKGLTFISTVDLLTTDYWISTDYGRLRQILNNLLSNAVKFTFKGTVSLTVRKEGDSVLRFDVADTGIGIRPEKIEQLFKPFTQADESFTRRFGGTGLGLSTAFSMSNLLSATLNVQSEEGVGTTFTLRLPFHKGTPKVTVNSEHTFDLSEHIEQVRQTYLILVVEDNTMNQKVVLKNLEKLGFKAVGADNGLEAIQLLQATPNQFALIFMDCSMPVMDGYTATQEIRKLPAPICNIPIVAMTANVLHGEREHCLEVGMDNYLEKPAQRESMLEMIKRYFRAPL